MSKATITYWSARFEGGIFSRQKTSFSSEAGACADRSLSEQFGMLLLQTITSSSTGTESNDAKFSFFESGLGSAGLGSAGLGSVGVGSVGVGSVGVGSAGLGSVGVGSARLGSAGLGSAGLGSAGLGSAGLGWVSVMSPTSLKPKEKKKRRKTFNTILKVSHKFEEIYQKCDH